MEHSDLGGRGKYAHWQIDNKLDEAATNLTAHEAIYHPPLTATSHYLTAGVNMTDANTYYDGPSVDITAGTWLVTGGIQMRGSGTNTNARGTAKLWDGTTVKDSKELLALAAGTGAYSYVPLSLSGIFTGPATVKISVASGAGGAAILAACFTNGAGNNASNIKAVRIA